MKAIVCQCVHGNILTAEARRELLAALGALEGRWTAVPDLCGAAARRDAWLAEWFEGPDEPRAILGCHVRAVRWMLRWAGAPPALDAVRVINLREEPLANVVAILRSLVSPNTGEGAPAASTPPEQGTSDAWIPWFPVIDRDRCTNCHQCKNFCPFGVYTTDEVGHVEVSHPTHCKTNCPACARLCPQLAIMFPKHNQRPIDGAPVSKEDEARRREAQLEKRLKQEDIHAILAKRRKLGGETGGQGDSDQSSVSSHQ